MVLPTYQVLLAFNHVELEQETMRFFSKSLFK